jgi:hypothetical protein
MVKTTIEIMSKLKADAFDNGIRYALDYLREVYGAGIEETDIWADYMNDENN